jgi:V/A-type H+-transporting ATPase subunit B
MEIESMLNLGWELFAKYFTKAEVAIRQELVDKYWPAKQ